MIKNTITEPFLCWSTDEIRLWCGYEWGTSHWGNLDIIVPHRYILIEEPAMDIKGSTVWIEHRNWTKPLSQMAIRLLDALNLPRVIETCAKQQIEKYGEYEWRYYKGSEQELLDTITKLKESVKRK